MIRKSLISVPPLFLMPTDKRRCVYITNYVIVQCIIVLAASITVLRCLWSPDRASFDFYKLASIMYLYDSVACGYSLTSKAVANLRLSNDTMGLDVLAIKWEPAVVTVSTRLSAKTRKYVKLSLAIHVVWMVAAISLRIICKNNKHPQLLKFILTCFLYTCIFVILFDLSMAIVYVAHIRQSLTKGMILRYSGWSVLLKLKNTDDFGGWLPMLASACWMRAILILALNIYCARIIRHITRKIKRRQFKARYIRDVNMPLPEAKQETTLKDNVLYYDPGTLEPKVSKGPKKFFPGI